MLTLLAPFGVGDPVPVDFQTEVRSSFRASWPRG